MVQGIQRTSIACVVSVCILEIIDYLVCKISIVFSLLLFFGPTITFVMTRIFRSIMNLKFRVPGQYETQCLPEKDNHAKALSMGKLCLQSSDLRLWALQALWGHLEMFFCLTFSGMKKHTGNALH